MKPLILPIALILGCSFLLQAFPLIEATSGNTSSNEGNSKDQKDYIAQLDAKVLEYDKNVTALEKRINDLNAEMAEVNRLQKPGFAQLMQQSVQAMIFHTQYKLAIYELMTYRNSLGDLPKLKLQNKCITEAQVPQFRTWLASTLHMQSGNGDFTREFVEADKRMQKFNDDLNKFRPKISAPKYR